jgi:hypothetical protein
LTTLPTATAPSAAKHPAASHVVLTIFQSLRPLPQDSLRFYWGGYAAECLSIMAIPRNQPSRGRCFVRDNGSCFGMRASEGLFGCLSSRMADFRRKESQPKVLTDNLWMETVRLGELFDGFICSASQASCPSRCVGLLNAAQLFDERSSDGIREDPGVRRPSRRNVFGEWISVKQTGPIGTVSPVRHSAIQRIFFLVAESPPMAAFSNC